MLSLREAALKSGNTFPIGLRQLAESKNITSTISLKQTIATSLIDSYWYKLGGPKSKIGKPMGEASTLDSENFVRSYRGGNIKLLSSSAAAVAYQQKAYPVIPESVEGKKSR